MVPGSLSKRWTWAFLTAIPAALGASSAFAQSTTSVADQLFAEGQKLMDAGNVHEACEKFADSQRVEPAIGALMHLAVCYEKEGRLATAWGEFKDVAAQAERAGQAERERFARGHVGELEKRLPKLVVELQQTPRGVEIQLDGQGLPVGVLGTEIPLDPGEHALQVSAPGKKTWKEAKLKLEERLVTRTAVTLEDAVAVDQAEPPSPPQPRDPARATPPTAARDAPSASNASSSKRVMGFGLGAAGLIGLGVATFEVVTALNRNSIAPNYPAGTPERSKVQDQEKLAWSYALAFGAAGAFALGTGLYLVLTSQSPPPAAPKASARLVPTVGPRVAWVVVDSTW